MGFAGASVLVDTGLGLAGAVAGGLGAGGASGALAGGAGSFFTVVVSPAFFRAGVARSDPGDAVSSTPGPTQKGATAFARLASSSMDAFTAVSSSLDLGPSARSRRVAALAAAALRSDAMFPPRYSRTSSLSDMPVFNNALTAAESTSIFGMVIAAVSASWDGPFVDVVAVAPRSFFILAGKPASWAVDSAGGFSGPAELARGESGRTSGVCLKARRSHVCRSVRVRSMRVRRGSRTRSLAGPRAMGPVRFDASSSPFFLGRLSGCGERFTTNEESGSANRILASLLFFSCIFSRTRLTRAFSVTCVEPNTKSQCQNISSCVSNNPGCR